MGGQCWPAPERRPPDLLAWGERHTPAGRSELFLPSSAAAGPVSGERADCRSGGPQRSIRAYSASKPLLISLLIPDTVLTGSRYDVDVVVDELLGKSLLAGGLIS